MNRGSERGSSAGLERGAPEAAEQLEQAVPSSALRQVPMEAAEGRDPATWHRQMQGQRIAAEMPAARWARMQQERAAVGESLRHRIGVQRKAAGQPDGGAKIPRGAGAELPAEVRGRMEPQLGAELSHVRVHTGAESGKAAADMGARAFAVGSDVHFGSGEFAPGTKEGDRLLAHELTHTVQAQRSGIQRKAAEEGVVAEGHGEHKLSEPGEPAEEEADAIADQATAALHGDGEAEGGGAEQAGAEKAPAIGAKLDGVGLKIFRGKKDKLTGKTEHAKDRQKEGQSDPHRQVGDPNRVVHGGRKFEDTETGNIVYVDGDRVVITDKAGRQVTQFKNSRANTQQRIRSGKWKPID